MEMKVMKELTIHIEKKELMEFIRNKIPDYDIEDIFNVDSGTFEKDGYIIVDVKLN